MGVVSGKTKLGNRKMFFRHRQTTGVLFLRRPVRSVHALVRAILLVWGPKLRLGPLAWFLRRPRVIRPHRNRHPASSYGKGAQRRNRRGKKNPGATAARGSPIGAAVAFRISSRRGKGLARKSGPNAHATNSQANAYDLYGMADTERRSARTRAIRQGLDGDAGPFRASYFDAPALRRPVFHLTANLLMHRRWFSALQIERPWAPTRSRF
jgi:hypothetical protein